MTTNLNYNINIVGLILFFSLVGIGIYAYANSQSIMEDVEQFINVKLYDTTGKLVKPDFEGQSIVNSVENIAFIKIKINVKNLGDRDMIANILLLEPTELNNKVVMSSIIVKSGELGGWESDFIDVKQWEGQKTEFKATVEGKWSYGSGETKKTKTGSVYISVDPDPELDFDVIIDSGIQGSVSSDMQPENPIIIEEPEITPLPQTQQKVVFRTNVNNGGYGNCLSTTGCWIAVLKNGVLEGAGFLGKYDSGYCKDTYRLTYPIVAITPENYVVIRGVTEQSKYYVCDPVSDRRILFSIEYKMSSMILNSEPTEPFRTNKQEVYQ